MAENNNNCFSLFQPRAKVLNMDQHILLNFFSIKINKVKKFEQSKFFGIFFSSAA